MAIKFSNNAATALAAGLTNSATSCTVASGDGSKFPALTAGDYFRATISSGASVEIVKVTARAGDVMTIVRGDEGTTGLAFSSGASFALLITAQDLYDLASAGATATATATATEALTAGRFVNVYNNAGTVSARHASASLGYEANGFVVSAVSNGASATVNLGGINAGVSGLTAGSVWLGDAGVVSGTAPTTVGYLSQLLGIAISATAVAFTYEPGVTLAAVPTTLSVVLGMVRLAQVVCAGSQTTITFSSISGSYSSLKIIIFGRLSAGTANFANWMLFNGDTTAANYDANHNFSMFGTTSGSGAETPSVKGMVVGSLPGPATDAQALSITEILIPGYAQTTFQKMAQAKSSRNAGSGNNLYDGIWQGRWKNTAPITSVTFTADSGTYVDGTTATLYGLL